MLVDSCCFCLEKYSCNSCCSCCSCCCCCYCCHHVFVDFAYDVDLDVRSVYVVSLNFVGAVGIIVVQVEKWTTKKWNVLEPTKVFL